MFRLAPYVLKSLWRNRTRTVLTLSGAAVALFVFCFVGAASEGLARLTRDGDDRTLVVFQANRFCPATSHLPMDHGRQLAALGGVRDVVPIQVFTNNCRASLDVVVFHGMPPEKLQTARQLKLADGEFDNFAGRDNAALVGRAVADRRKLRRGDTFTVGQVSVFVAGVFRSASAAEENVIYTHLDFLQKSPGLNAVGTVTQFEVLLDEAAQPDAASRSIDAHFRTSAAPTDTKPKSAFETGAIADLAELIGLVRYLGFACVGLVFALVVTTTVMTVQDRIVEHAVLQAIGFSPLRIFAVVVGESLLVSLGGGALGVASALAILARTQWSLGAEAVAVALSPSLSLAFGGLAVAGGVGLLSGTIPGWQAARADIVRALRPA